MKRRRASTSAASGATNSVDWSPRASTAENPDGKAGDAEMEVSRSIYKAQPICILPEPGESWSVPVESLTSKRFRWSEADYGPGLDFAFDVQDARFSLSSSDEELYALAGGIPFVAVATIGHHTRIRLIPVVGEVGLQSEVYDLEFDRAERGERMVRELVKMGCTVVRRPEG
ncbi:MAG: hypothetical protein LQ349_001764 [Xanthoria aureola]|nr:MAG: hypothetical protein LQ349_001764 [Xanthoria aureola]